MAGDTILCGSGKAGSALTAVLGHAVLSELKAVTAKRQASAISGLENTGEHRLMNFSTKRLYVSWSSNYREETGLSVSRGCSVGFFIEVWLSALHFQTTFHCSNISEIVFFLSLVKGNSSSF